ncbi:MAG: DnaD domain protein [Oscillospiraceae bacterium]|jgi:DnaD/phage-associated family protein|nr:DnaD domain protein [Oscillospiraceae bacterium]
MNHKLNLGAWNSVFAVPSAVVDNYIKLAGGNNLKVLLFILRNAGGEIAVDEVSAKTGVISDDVKDALLFWEQTGILAIREDELTPSDTLIESEASRPAANYKKIELERDPHFFPKEIARAVRNDKGMDFLFKECERIFGRPLKHNEQNSLMVITEDVGIPAECALMLVEYCASCGKATPAYMRKIAKDWHEREILTINEAENEIKILREINSFEGRLKRLLEMKRAFSEKEKTIIRRWSSGNYEEEILYAAYQMTLDGANEMSFPYMNKILENWDKDGIKNKEQLEESQKKSKKNKKQNEDSKSSFDIDKIWQNIIEK